MRRLLLVFTAIILTAYFIGDKMAKNYGFNGLGDFISNYYSNQELAAKFTPKTVKIELSDNDYQFIKDKRNEALDRGLQINVGDNYVPCKLLLNGKIVEGEMRLKGHMTDHLQGDKWSYRVKTKDEFLGMYRFSLQHPGTRGYIKEWVYHQLLAEEEIINLYYDFIHLELNDKDLGIYAIEEHFGQHVLERNNRPKGAILRWNPELYWEGRIDEYQVKYLDQQYGHYYSSFAEPYDKGKVLKDDELKANYILGATQLELFRRGELTTSEAFDIEKMASFHAIIDLVGGHHSLDWSDVKYYYNSETKKIEPVGYESFSIRKTEHISGQQLPEKFNGVEADYHQRLFADPIFFEAYIRALERIASEEYLNNFIAAITPLLNEKLGCLAHEFSYIPFNWDPYFENIELIRHNLSLPKAVHPFLKSKSDSLIVLSIGVVADFPIEIVALHVNDKRIFKPIEKTVLPQKERNTFSQYFDVKFENNGKKVKNLILEVKIPGSSNSFKVEVADFKSFEIKEVQNDTISDGKIKYSQSSVYIENGYVIPQDSSLSLSGVDSIFISGTLINNGLLRIVGYVDHPIIITQVNPQNASNLILNTANIYLENVHFIGCQPIKSSNGQINIHQCEIIDQLNFLTALETSIVVSSSFVQDVAVFANLDNCMFDANELHASTGTNFLNINGGSTNITSSSFHHFNTFVSLDQSATMKTWSTKIINCNQVGVLSNTSSIKIMGGEISNSSFAFTLDENSFFPFPSTYTLYKTTTKNITKLDNKVG